MVTDATSDNGNGVYLDVKASELIRNLHLEVGSNMLHSFARFGMYILIFHNQVA